MLHSLSLEERQLIKRWSFKTKRGRSPKYGLLLDRMLDHELWNVQSEAIIRGTEFLKSDVYYRTREKLLYSIIHALSYSPEEEYTIDFVTKAVELNALELAQKTFEAAISKAERNSSQLAVLQWHQLRNQVFREYRVELRLPPNLRSPRSILEELKADFHLREILDQVQELRTMSVTERQWQVPMLLHRLSVLEVDDEVQRFEKNRLLSRVYLFQGKQEEAVVVQQEAIDTAPKELSVPLLAQEMVLLSQLYCDIGDLESAQFWGLKLSQLPCSTSRAELIKQELWIRSTMILAERRFSFDLAKLALEALKAFNGTFPSSSRAINFYFGAVVAFGNGAYSESRVWLEEARSAPKKSRPILTWQIDLLRALIDLEEGEDIDSALRATKRILRRESVVYPQIVLGIIEQLFKASDALNLEQIEIWKSKLLPLLSNPSEMRCSYFFDAILWLDAKGKNTTMAALKPKRNSPKRGESIAFI